MNSRVTAVIPPGLMKSAAIRGMFRPTDGRAMIVRYSLIRLLPDIDDETALELSKPDVGGRPRKDGMEPSHNQVAAPIPEEYLKRLRDEFPDLTTSQLTRYALYRVQGWNHEDALEACVIHIGWPKGKPRGKRAA